MPDNDIYHEFRGEIERLKERIAEQQKTPWATIVSVATVVVMILLAFFALINSRFDSTNIRFDGLVAQDNEVRAAVDKFNAEAVRRAELLATKEALNVEIASANRRLEEVSAALVIINNELVRRRAEFVEQVEFRAFEKRFDGVEKAQDAHFRLFLTKDAFDAWKIERDKTIGAMQKQIETNHTAIHSGK